jgi:hypothetical protein
MLLGIDETISCGIDFSRNPDMGIDVRRIDLGKT